MCLTKKFAVIVCIFFALLSALCAWSTWAEEPKTSYKYIVVYGEGDLKVGDVIEIYDPEGTLCGKWAVRDKGAYGLMAVFGDDPTTEDIDEGAEEGEYLTIKVNGKEVYPPGGQPVWEKEGETRRVNLD